MSKEKKKNKSETILWYLIIALLILMISFALVYTYINVFGQVFPEEYENCVIRDFKERAYTPFRIEMIHEPALKQKTSDEHNDPKSRLIFEQIEQEVDDAPTRLAFYTNSTDDWTIRVDLEYKTTHSEPREIRIDYNSGNRDLMDERIFHEGFDFCIVYLIQARPPPVIPSPTEILELADKIQQENFDVVAREIRGLIEAVIRSEDTNTVIGLFMVILFVTFTASGFINRRQTKKLIKHFQLENKRLATSRENDKMFQKQQMIENLELRSSTQNRLQSLINTTENTINSVILSLRDGFKPETKPKKEIIFPEEAPARTPEKETEYYDETDKTRQNKFASIDVLSEKELNESGLKARMPSKDKMVTAGIKLLTKGKDKIQEKLSRPSKPIDSNFLKWRTYYKNNIKTEERLREKYNYFHAKYLEIYEQDPKRASNLKVHVDALYDLVIMWGQE